MSLGERRAMIVPSHPGLSVVRQCALVRLNRSGVYHRPRGERAATLALMRLIDEAYYELKISALPGLAPARLNNKLAV